MGPITYGRPVTAERVALGVAGVLVAAAVVIGAVLLGTGVPLLVEAPPLFARWGVHVGPGTPLALLVAGLVLWLGPRTAQRLGWARLLAAAWLAATAWTVSLALVDGWSTGVAGRLAVPAEYLSEVPTAPPVADLLAGFADRIVAGQPDSWTTHVSGHPPGALLVFVGLDRAGLVGGAWAGVVAILAGASAVVAVGVALRALSDEEHARLGVLFAVLAPGAIWVGVSADAIFLAVSAWGVALVALSTRMRGWRSDVTALAAGLVLGWCLYLSYGLVLVWGVALVVVLLQRRPRVLLLWVLGAGFVVVLVTVAGFAWWEGYELVRIRYFQGYGGARPYAYWVWANLAAMVLVLGPAVVAGLGRVVVLAPGAYASWRAGAPSAPAGVSGLVLAGVAAVVAATVSGLSKAEVERIWLPFAVWVAVAATLLPAARTRAWLAAQAVTALVLAHVLVTPW